MSRAHPRVDDIERFAKLYALGCVVSKIYFNRWEPAEIHHLVEGRKRLGHQFTIPLSPWFHRGIPPLHDMRPSDAEKQIGPSLARSKREFTCRFGTERELLERTNNLLADIQL
jgi:hypothetical protein